MKLKTYYCKCGWSGPNPSITWTRSRDGICEINKAICLCPECSLKLPAAK